MEMNPMWLICKNLSPKEKKTLVVVAPRQTSLFPLWFSAALAALKKK